MNGIESSRIVQLSRNHLTKIFLSTLLLFVGVIEKWMLMLFEEFFSMLQPGLGLAYPSYYPLRCITPAPPNAASDVKSKNLYCDSKSFHVDVGIMYIIVPNAVMPTPTHHHVSGLYGSLGLRIVFAFLFNGSTFSPVESCRSRLTLLLPVDWAPPVALVVGFRV
jgi:hypothetical protein